jgi:soluble lytic murein transglycosylase-like protein
MARYLFTIGVLLVGCLGARAEIIRYRSSDGRLYYTNVPPAHLQTLPAPGQSSLSRSPGLVEQAQTLRLIRELAQQYDIEPRLVQAIIRVESNFNPYAVSRAGAQGLMQLMPATAKRYQVEDPFNPRANIEAGLRHLKELLRRFPGNMRHVLAAYNAGADAVQRYGGVPPYQETQRYVERVLALYSQPPRRKIYRYRTTNGSILFTDTPR